MINLKKNLDVVVGPDHIRRAKCRDPNRCMVRLAIIDAVGKKCYCKVDMTGIAITRRTDYREWARIPRKVAIALLRFDNRMHVEPFKFTLNFAKSTKVVSEDRKAEVVRKRNALKAQGIKPKRYTYATRTAGIAMSKSEAARYE